MKKKRRKIAKRTKKNEQKKQILMGVSILAVVASLVFSVYYIIQSKASNDVNKNSVGENIGLEKKSSVIDASFKEGATYLGSHCAGVCHMSPKSEGDVLVKYNGDIIVSGDITSGGHHFTDHLTKTLKIPAGKYTVKLESFDSYTGRKSTDPSGQKEEQYKVIFRNGGTTLAQTKESQDLRDGRDEANTITVVNGPNNPIILNSDADGIVVQHTGTKATGDAGALNGFEPVCMLMEKIEEPHCGDGIKNDGEDCDEGEEKNGKVPAVSYGKTKTYCKSDCTIGTVVGGQCGNGRVEGDEDCDDGNIKDGDGCDATCQKEEVKDEKKEKKESCKASIGDYIWYDTNNNGVQEDIEEGISGVKVCASKGNKKYCDTTNKNGKYKIKKLCKGTYSVKVKGTGGMIQTFDPDGQKDNKTKVKLKNKQKYVKADFGYRGKAPKTGLATNIMLLIGLSTVITIGILLVMRKRGKI